MATETYSELQVGLMDSSVHMHMVVVQRGPVTSPATCYIVTGMSLPSVYHTVQSEQVLGIAANLRPIMAATTIPASCT